MSDQTPSTSEVPQVGQHDPPPASKKKKLGRPKGSTNAAMAARKKDPTGELAQAEKRAKRQRTIIRRQRADCERLAKVIKEATPGTVDPKDIGSLTRATSQLHDMERQAHDFGAKGGQVKAVILIPTPDKTMDTWAKKAEKVLGLEVTQPAKAVKAVVVEDDIQGEAPPEPPEEDHE